MSKFGDDLIRSLKEAVNHAKGEGPGWEQVPASPPKREANDVQPDAAGAAGGRG